MPANGASGQDGQAAPATAPSPDRTTLRSGDPPAGQLATESWNARQEPSLIPPSAV